MASFPIDIRLEIDDKEFRSWIERATQNAEQLRPALKKSGIIMYRSFDLNFKRQGRPRKWKPLARNTIASRRKFSKKVLQDTGRTRMSVIARSAAGNIYKLTSNSLKMGTRLKTAAYHQWGTEPYTIVPKNKTILRFMTAGGVRFAKQVNHPGLPARPFVLIQDEDVRAMTKVFAEHVVGE